MKTVLFLATALCGEEFAKEYTRLVFYDELDGNGKGIGIFRKLNPSRRAAPKGKLWQELSSKKEKMLGSQGLGSSNGDNGAGGGAGAGAGAGASAGLKSADELYEDQLAESAELVGRCVLSLSFLKIILA